MPIKSSTLFVFALFLVFGFPSSGWANVNINLASETELSTLNGIGPAKAKAIVAHRLQYGRFNHIDELQQVKGIGPILYQRIKADVHVDAQTLATPSKPRPLQPRPALKRITPIGQRP